jgi:hypothetical protein
MLISIDRAVFVRSITGIVDSKPTQSMDVYVYSVFVLGSDLLRAGHPFKGSYRLC